MSARKPPLVLTFVRDFAARESVVGGEQVRPLELFELLGRHGVAAEVWCVAPSAPRELGSLKVRRLPLPRWGPAREMLAVPVSLLVFLARALRHRVVLYQRVAGGVAMKGRLPYVSEPGWLFFGLARLLGVTTWASMHDLSPEHEMNALNRAARSGIDVPEAERQRTTHLARINSAIQKWALPRATVATVVSESLRREVTQRYAITNEKVFIVRAGFNPAMLQEVAPWVPPTDRPWTIAYVGSRLDMELGVLLDATSALGDKVELLLAGRGMNEVAATVGHSCQVMDATYSHFPELANRVDIWVVPIGSDPYLHWGWHLKLPMDLATGRPVVLAETEELSLSGLEHLFFVASPSPVGIHEQIELILRDPEGSYRRATEASDEAWRTMQWENRFGPVLRHLGLDAGSTILSQ